MVNNLSRRQFLQISGAAATVGLLAACVPQTAPAGGAAEGGEAATSAGVNLVWDTFRGPGTGWNEERIDTFKADHPEVSIEFRPLTGASQQDNYGKMYALFAAGDLGDVCADSVTGLVEEAEACFARLCVSNDYFSKERDALDASLRWHDRKKFVPE